jgi:predicted nuclease of predicted toxin-antitoxin system
LPRLLFDENLSPRLVRRLAAVYPGSQHVSSLGLRGASDLDIWARAAADGFVLVSKDDDFRQLSFLRGAPPKVIWLVVGNAGTELVAQLLERQSPLIATYVAGTEESLLILRLPDAR